MASKTRRWLVVADVLLSGALVAGCTEPSMPEHGPAAAAARAASCLASAGAVGVDNIAVTDPMPQLLLYSPGPSTSPADWVDFAGEDGPYELVGWAYIGPYAPDSPPPRRRCIAASEWFVHEAGWHLMDGGMLLTPGATAPPPPPDVPVLFWHPRAWDLHLWIGPDGVASVAFANPNARGGGMSLPAGAFLRVVDGRLVPSAAG